MTRLSVLLALAIASVWVGLEIDPARDALAWVFLLGVPVTCMVVEVALRVSATAHDGKEKK